MVLLSLSAVRKAFGTNEVIRDATLALQEGERLGLVGVNGSGKTTLLKIINGDMPSDGGEISIAKDARIGFLTQHADIDGELSIMEELTRVFDPLIAMEKRLRALEAEMAEAHEDAEAFARLSNEYDKLTRRFEDAGGYEWPSRVQGVLAGLGFAKDRRDMPARLLSGGEKTRLCLARILLMQPEILMLDEPTNHLDLAAVGWLEDTLKKYPGTVIVISHDRYFLNAVCDCMAELSMGRLTRYSGNYDAFVRKRQANLERQLKEYKLQQAEIARQEAIIARYRMFNREKSIKAAESREKRLEKIVRLEKPVSEDKVRFSFEARRRTGEDVLIAKDLSKSYDGRKLFEHFSLHLRAGDRVALIGPNGVGKTTLLRIFVGEETADGGTMKFGANVDIGYYDQHQAGLHPDKDVLNELWDDFPRLDADRVRGVLALFLFTGDDVFQKIHTLSGGERGRLALAKLMLRKDNLLFMDEPTNHLDMDSREVLEHALDDFDGTLLAVSHDRYFINRVANRVIEMSAEGVSEYLGNYDDYLEKKRAALLPEEAASDGLTQTQRDKLKRKERLARESRRQLEDRVRAAEAEIARTEAEVAHLEAEMAAPGAWQDPEAGRALTESHARAKETLDALYDEWAELAELLEEKA
ncbi:MAG TPA: ABC-F family ATP-binding cassette domain-containing protein [Candidatus Ornithocaccomicrobium faecavium]|uniref:ABC-F family ATP-binding cassette domain-containing protein n=2 Tax=Clostridia incertae sedis TaxID=189325 RepID=A0A9D1TDB0_9FIRM|nr:ABC-F family ATP-binding cassette domain-containing protein [Candidatus Ornithocaccomicrobium faecavium]